MRQRKGLWAIGMVCFCLIVGCGNGTPTLSTDNLQSVTDDYGREVMVPTLPKRIVSTSPAITEILFALGADNLLVGRTDFCSYPPEATTIASIGGISNLNIESIVALHPDIVISGSMVSAKIIHTLEQMGIPVVCILEKQHYEGLYDNIARIGQLCGHSTQADSLIAHLKELLISMELPLKQENTRVIPSVYYVVGFGPAGNFTAGGNTYINDIISLAGGENIAANINGWNYSLETLSDKDPDFILIRREDSAHFCNSHPYCDLSAVKNHHVIGIESGTIDLQVPRNIEAVQKIAQRIRL